MQPRDLAIIDAVHRLRVLTSDQVAALLFPTASGKVSSQCRKRLQLLSEAGYLDRREQPQTRAEGRKPYLYFLAPAGRDLLIEELGKEPASLDWKPSYNDVRWPFLRHQLAVNDVYLAFSLAAPSAGWELLSWTDDRLLRKAHTDPVRVVGPDGTVHESKVVPDAHLVLAVPGSSPGEPVWMQFFVECDLATEVVATTHQQRTSWQRKIRAYQAYFQSDSILASYRTNRIRVLTITTGERRLANLKEATEAEGGEKRYWFTTARALTPEAAIESPIWHMASSAELVSLRR